MHKKSFRIIPGLLLLLLSGCFSVRTNNHFTYEKLSLDVYRKMVSDSVGAYILDVRTPVEYQKDHISGAINHSYFNFHIRKDLDSLDRNKIVFVYCQTCHRSPLAAKTMKRMGFRKIYDLKGGFRKW